MAIYYSAVFEQISLFQLQQLEELCKGELLVCLKHRVDCVLQESRLEADAINRLRRKRFEVVGPLSILDLHHVNLVSEEKLHSLIAG
jgi:hypothetical protein